jgi:hypothetical protein
MKFHHNELTERLQDKPVKEPMQKPKVEKLSMDERIDLAKMIWNKFSIKTK